MITIDPKALSITQSTLDYVPPGLVEEAVRTYLAALSVSAPQPVAPITFKNGPVMAQLTYAEFLSWIADRLQHVHGENPNYDYMTRLRELAASVVPAGSASPSEAPDAWRAIETATDQERCFLWVVNSGVCFGRIRTFEDGERRVSIEGHSGDWKVTHFMPLPSPPSTGGQGE